MIYLDNNATTQIAPEVLETMLPYLTDFYGNPSSAHTFGRNSQLAIEKARESVAEALGANDASEIVFTSSGTESTNWAIRAALELPPKKKKIVITRVEHEVVTKTCEHLERRGYEIVWLDVDSGGQLDLDALRNSIDEQTAFVSIMAANNETGILFPVARIAEIVKERSAALFHVDGVQAVGKIPVNLEDTQIDSFAVSGHKFHAPKGIGALYIRDGLRFSSLLLGGGQEGKRRAGTESVASIVALGAACNLIKNLDFNRQISVLRDRLENEILQRIPNSSLNGTADVDLRLPNTSNISFVGVDGEGILAHLDAHNIYVSTGSACTSDAHTGSSVLRAMNIPYQAAMGAVRFSLSRYTTQQEIDFTLEILPQTIEKLRDISPLV